MTNSFETIIDLDLVTGGTAKKAPAQLPKDCVGMTSFYRYALKNPTEHPDPAAFCRSAKAQMGDPASSDGREGGI